MSNDGLESCPKCKQGVFRPTGDVGTIGDRKGRSSNTREYICDKCGQRKVGVHIIENEPVTEWIAEHSKDLSQYEGKYVAIQDFIEDIKVIASGSYEQVMAIVEQTYPNIEPLIMKIPTKDITI